MTIKDKENKAPEVDLFGEVDIAMRDEALKAEKQKKSEEIKRKKELQNLELERKREEYEYFNALSDEEILRKINEEPFSPEDKILNEMNGFYSFKNADTSYDIEYVSFMVALRSFLLGESFSDGEEYFWKEKLQHPLKLDFFKNFYLKNKKSKNLMLELIVNILSSLRFLHLTTYLFKKKIRIQERDWHKIYLKKYLQTYQEEADFFEKFIASSFYDSDLKFSVSNKENKIKITWKLDQSFIGSNNIFEGRDEAVHALFDYGNIIEHLGEFDMRSAPNVIKENISARPMGTLRISFWKLEGKNNRQICEGWYENKIGQKIIKRGKRSISLEWKYPKSFKPYENSLITLNCRNIFAEISEYMHPDYNKEIMNMIRYSTGEFG